MGRKPASPPAQPRDEGIQLLGRAVTLLRSLEHAPAGLTLSEMSSAADLPKSTAHRLLVALEREGMVSRGNGRFRLGLTLARLGAASSSLVRSEILPYMHELSAALNETVDLGVLDGAGVRFIEQIAAPQRLRAVSAVGETFPLYCTANGKVLLAALDRQDAQARLPARLQAITQRTITSKRVLWEQVDQIRQTGVAFDREEHTPGICAVGAAITDAFGTLMALTVALPSQRFYGKEDALAEQLLGTIREANRALNGRARDSDRATPGAGMAAVPRPSVPPHGSMTDSAVG